MPSLLDFIGTLAQQSVPMVSGAMRGRQARQQQDRKEADETADREATMRRYLLQQAQLDEDRRHNQAVEGAALSRQTEPSAYGGRTREQWLADHAAQADVEGRTRAKYRAGDGDGGAGQFTRLQQRNIAREQAEAQIRTLARRRTAGAADYNRISRASGGVITPAELELFATEEYEKTHQRRHSEPAAPIVPRH